MQPNSDIELSLSVPEGVTLGYNHIAGCIGYRFQRFGVFVAANRERHSFGERAIGLALNISRFRLGDGVRVRLFTFSIGAGRTVFRPRIGLHFGQHVDEETFMGRIVEKTAQRPPEVAVSDDGRIEG